MSATYQHKIVFTPSGLNSEVVTGESILKAAQDSQVSIRSLCGGNGQCHQCWVEIPAGKYPKYGIECDEKSLSPLSELERELIAKNPKYVGKRLACQTAIAGDVVVDVPESSQEHAAYISKTNIEQDFSVVPSVRLITCQILEASLDENPSAAENLLEQLQTQHQIKAVVLPNEILPFLQKAIADGKNNLTIALRSIRLPFADNDQIIYEVAAVYPIDPLMMDAKEVDAIGAAVDIGSTTIAVYVYQLHTGMLLAETSAMNPQIKFGEDLMSRVSYVMMNPDGRVKLTEAVQNKLIELLSDACKQIDRAQNQLLEVVLVGNPIMHHLFLGISPVELGQAPFTVCIRDWLDTKMGALGLDWYPNTRLSFLPLIAGHVGADTAGAYLSVMDTMHSKTTLMVDIGTNAEIMLAKDGKVYATSSPTGPAFEGAEISSGVRASHGAIERVRIASNTCITRYKCIGDQFWSDEAGFSQNKPTGLCGSGIIEAIVDMARVGLIDQSGLFVPDTCPERFDYVGKMHRFLLVADVERPIYIEQGDIRSIQLAKAALAAGVRLLMDYLDCTSFDQVLLAGAFGAHLDGQYVADLDIIPTAKGNQVKTIGNAAGIGAAMALLDVNKQQTIIDAVENIRKIESANEPNFQQYFVEAMSFSISPIEKREPTTRPRRRRR